MGRRAWNIGPSAEPLWDSSGRFPQSYVSGPAALPEGSEPFTGLQTVARLLSSPADRERRTLLPCRLPSCFAQRSHEGLVMA